MKYINTITLLKVLLSVICFSVISPLWGQMPGPDGQQAFGNEWIDYDKSYLRIPVGQDGMHIVTYDDLLLAGWAADELQGQHFSMYYQGKQVPIWVSNEGLLAENDHLIFYGEKNRTSLEDFIFHQPDRQMLNPEYSLFSDTSAPRSWSGQFLIFWKD